MEPSMISASKLPSVLQLECPEVRRVQKPNAVQALDEMLNAIVSSVEPNARSKFIEACENAASSRKGLEQLMAENVITHASSLASGSGSTESLSISPLSPQECVPAALRPGSDSQIVPLLRRSAPPKEQAMQDIPSIDRLTRHLIGGNDGSDEATSVPRPRRQITVKHYSDATPSMHCHICCRSSKNIKVYACARIKEAICRKVVCSRCFIDNKWQYEEGWECSHCRGICPARSQCFTYSRSNLRRKLQASKRKLEKSQKTATPMRSLSPEALKKRYAPNTGSKFIHQVSDEPAFRTEGNGESTEKFAF